MWYYYVLCCCFSLSRVRSLYSIICGVFFCSMFFGCVFIANCDYNVSSIIVLFSILNVFFLSAFAIICLLVNIYL